MTSGVWKFMGKNGNTPPQTPAALMARNNAYPSDAVFGLNVRAMLEMRVRATEILVVGRRLSPVRKSRWRMVERSSLLRDFAAVWQECEIDY